MRTTLEIDDDVLQAAREQAKTGNTTVGRVISQLLRESLAARNAQQPRMRNGFRLLESIPSVRRPDLELVNSLRDEE
jgi:Arc/MetJ family transcription regulator